MSILALLPPAVREKRGFEKMQKVKKLTQEQQVVALCMRGWFSNFGMQQKLKSSSADRAFRRAREKGLDGYEFIQRVKKNAPVHCLEYRIVPVKKEEKQACNQ